VLTQSDSLQLWHAETGHLLATFTPGDAVAAAFSQDGRRVAIARRDNQIGVWDVETGQRHTEGSLGSYDFRLGEDSFRLSPDGQRGVSTASDGKISSWDVPTGTRDDSAVIAAVLEAVVGYRLNPGGGLEPIDDRLAALNDARTACGSSTSVSAQVCGWTLADRGTRTIGPFTNVTISDYVRRSATSLYPTDRNEAQRLFPWEVANVLATSPARQ